MVKQIIQLVGLLIIFISVFFFSWFWLENVNVLNTSNATDFVANLRGQNTAVEEVDLTNDSLLIDKIRLEKKEGEIEKLREKFAEESNALELQSKELADKIATVESARIDLESQQKSLNEISKLFEDKNERIRTVAVSLMNMPPQNAVDILVELEDNLMIETLLEVNKISEEQGLGSVVPFWLSLMNAERAGQVQTKIVELNR